MRISLSDLGKRYNREWIFRHLDYEFEQHHRYAITGSNGSGKSTLMQILSGTIHHNEGNIVHIFNNQHIIPEKIFKLVSFSAPYIEIPDEFNFQEILAFHFRFKKVKNHCSHEEIIELSGLNKSAGKQIRYYSSGMKQRVRLCLSFFADTPLLLLDEPCTNLDSSGISWYKEMMEKYSEGRLVIISSNDSQEYETCNRVLAMEDFKKI